MGGNRMDGYGYNPRAGEVLNPPKGIAGLYPRPVGCAARAPDAKGTKASAQFHFWGGTPGGVLFLGCAVRRALFFT